METLVINNGNSVTSVAYRKVASNFFWNQCYSNTYQNKEFDRAFVSKLDLMGNKLSGKEIKKSRKK